jgi:hypothetical protein
MKIIRHKETFEYFSRIIKKHKKLISRYKYKIKVLELTIRGTTDIDAWHYYTREASIYLEKISSLQERIRYYRKRNKYCYLYGFDVFKNGNSMSFQTSEGYIRVHKIEDISTRIEIVKSLITQVKRHPIRYLIYTIMPTLNKSLRLYRNINKIYYESTK